MLKGLKKLFTRSNPSSGGEEIDSVKNIPDFETWEKLSYAPLDATFANTVRDRITPRLIVNEWIDEWRG